MLGKIRWCGYGKATRVARVLAVVFCLSGAPSGPAAAQNPVPSAAPTLGRDLYVSCYLMVRDSDVVGPYKPFSATTCIATILGAVATREGARPNENNKSRFCLPKNAETAVDPSKSMAFAYLNFYESTDSVNTKSADASSQLVFTAAMILKWPCPDLSVPPPASPPR